MAWSDSYQLALGQPGVTLKAWHPPASEEQGLGHSHAACDDIRQDSGQSDAEGQMLEEQGRGQFRAASDVQFMTGGQVLEGQGKGQLLGPPAQRWAAASALKDSLNRWESAQ